MPEEKIYKEKCEYCDLEISSLYESQLKSNMAMHKFSKHKDKLKVEVKDGKKN
jgi:hypothetical protein